MRGEGGLIAFIVSKGSHLTIPLSLLPLKNSGRGGERG